MEFRTNSRRLYQYRAGGAVCSQLTFWAANLAGLMVSGPIKSSLLPRGTGYLAVSEVVLAERASGGLGR